MSPASIHLVNYSSNANSIDILQSLKKNSAFVFAQGGIQA